MREGHETDDDIEQIRAVEDNDTNNWPEQYVKFYIANHVASTENEQCVTSLNSEKYQLLMLIYLKKKKTGNLPKQLKVCLGARVMLINNVDTAHKLINGSCSQIKHMQGMYPNPLDHGTIYVKFDDPNAGNSKKNCSVPGELKECVPIRSTPKTFPWKFKLHLFLQEDNFLRYLVIQ